MIKKATRKGRSTDLHRAGSTAPRTTPTSVLRCADGAQTRRDARPWRPPSSAAGRQRRRPGPDRRGGDPRRQRAQGPGHQPRLPRPAARRRPAALRRRGRRPRCRPAGPAREGQHAGPARHGRRPGLVPRLRGHRRSGRGRGLREGMVRRPARQRGRGRGSCREAARQGHQGRGRDRRGSPGRAGFPGRPEPWPGRRRLPGRHGPLPDRHREVRERRAAAVGHGGDIGHPDQQRAARAVGAAGRAAGHRPGDLADPLPARRPDGLPLQDEVRHPGRRPGGDQAGRAGLRRCRGRQPRRRRDLERRLGAAARASPTTARRPCRSRRCRRWRSTTSNYATRCGSRRSWRRRARSSRR